MRRRLNIRFLALVLFAMTLGGGSIHVVHGFQEGRTAISLLRRGEQAERRGNVKEAEIYTARYLALRPEDDKALANYGLLLGRLATSPSDRVRVMQVLERALARNPGRSDLRRRIVELAMSAEIRRYRDARRHLKVLLKDTPEDGELQGQLGRCLEAFAAGEDTDTKLAGDAKSAYAEAAQWYSDSIKHAPGRVDSYVRLAGLLRGPLKDADRADRLMDAHGHDPGGANLIARNANSAEAYLARARYRGEYGIEGARGDVNRALALAPTDAEVLLAAADMAAKIGDLSEARSYLERGVSLHPKDWRMYQSLSSIGVRSGQLEEAASCLRMGLKALSDQKDLQWNLADILIRSRKLEEASELITNLRKRPNILNSVVDYLAARVLLEKGNLPEGVHLLEGALASMPGSIEYREIGIKANFLLASAYERLGNPDRQTAAFRRVLSLEPNSAAGRMGLASALLNQGRTHEAIATYREAIPLVPLARHALAEQLIYQNLKLPKEKRRWEEIQALLDEAHRLTPGSAELDILQAQLLLARGHAAEARVRLEQARDRQPENAEVWVALAAYAGDQGKMSDTMAVLNEARRRLGDLVVLRLARIGFAAKGGGDEARRVLDEMRHDLDGLDAGDRVRVEYGLAEAFMRIGDLDAAERLWTKVLETRPDDIRVATMLFEIALQSTPGTGGESAVRRAIDRLRRIEGEDGTLWRQAEATRLIGAAHRGDKTGIGTARSLLDEVQARRHGWSRASLLEAQIHELEGNTGQALAAYQRAIQEGEVRPEFVRRTVRLLGERGRSSEADRLIHQLVEQEPSSGDLARIAAEMALRQNDRQGALEFARRAIRADSVDPDDHLWLGQILSASGRAAEAEEEFRRAVALAPTRSECHVALVEFLSKEGRKPQADEAIGEARKYLPADVAHVALARCFEAIGHPGQAEAEYRIALAKKPGDMSLRLAIARCCLRTGRSRDAEATLRSILESSSKAAPGERAVARRNLVLILISESDNIHFREAITLIEENLKNNSDSIEDQRIKALILQTQPFHRREAIRTFEELARRSPPSPAEKFLLAQLYSSGNEWIKARDIFLGLLQTDSENPDCLSALAKVLLDHDRASEARGPIARLEEISPGIFTTVALKARLLQQQGNGNQAVALLETYARPIGINLGPVASTLESLGHAGPAEAMYRSYIGRSKQPGATLDLVRFLGRQGRAREALDLCEKARDSYPPDALSNACLYVINASKADDEQRRRVADWIEEAIRKSPNDVGLLFDLANLQIMRGNYSEAETRLRQIVALSPDSGGPMNNLAWLLAARGVKLDEALDLINRAIGLDGPAPELLDTRALIHLAMGQAEPALRDLNEAILTSPTPTLIFHLARTQMLAGRRDDARNSLRKARDGGLEELTIDPLEQEAYRKLMSALNQ